MEKQFRIIVTSKSHYHVSTFNGVEIFDSCDMNIYRKSMQNTIDRYELEGFTLVQDFTKDGKLC